MKGFMKLSLATLAFSLFTATSAQAGILLEPYLGYGMGTYKWPMTVLGVSSEDKGDANGLLYGARVGYGFAMVTLAADVSMGSTKLESDDGSDGGESSDLKNLGATVIVSAPALPVRAWLGYSFDSEAKEGDTKLKGTALKLGGGYSFMPMLSLNLEYIMTTFDDLNGTKFPTTIAPSVTADKLKINTIFLSVSVPLGW